MAMQERLAELKSARKLRIAEYKRTAARAAAQADDLTKSATPAEPTRLPTKSELTEMAELEDSAEEDGLATAVLEAMEAQPEDRISDGFAALRAQRAMRKKSLRDHKRSAVCAKEAQKRRRRRRKPKPKPAD